MTLFNKFIGFIAFAAVLFACKKEMSSENTEGPAVIDTKWEFKEGEALFQGNIDTAFISRQPGFSVLTIEGKSIGDNNGVLLLQIGTDSLVKGTYTSDDLYFQYSENGTMLYESITGNPDVADFSLTIDVLDSASISGIFGGAVVTTDSTLRNIVEGKFSAELMGGPVVGPGPDTIPDPDPDTIPEPDPDADYLPLGNVWTYGNVSDPALYDQDTVRIVSQPEVEIDGNTYTPFLNEVTGKIRYFRKDTTAGLYYEYLQATQDLPLESPAEIIILQENFTQDFSWESPEYTLIYVATGIETRITAKIQNTITTVNGSYELNGKIYHNVMEVVSTLLVKQSDGTFYDSGSYATNYYAKGIGIIAYGEETTGVGYGLRHYDVIP